MGVEIGGLEFEIAIKGQGRVAKDAGIFGGAGESEGDTGVERSLVLGAGEEKDGAWGIAAGRVGRSEFEEDGRVVRAQAERGFQRLPGAGEITGAGGGAAEV